LMKIVFKLDMMFILVLVLQYD